MLFFVCLVPKIELQVSDSVQKPWRNILWTAEYVLDFSDHVSLCVDCFYSSVIFFQTKSRAHGINQDVQTPD